MNIGVQINSRTFGDYVTEDFVAHVRSQGSKIMVEFMYPLEEGFNQESGWVFLTLRDGLRRAGDHFGAEMALEETASLADGLIA